MRTSSVTRPGRAAIITTRLERYTASWIECVTNMHRQALGCATSSSSSPSSLLRRDLVEGAERLVHQQELRLDDQGRGRSRPAFACRPRALRGRACAKRCEAHQSQRFEATRGVGLVVRHAGEIEGQAHVGRHAGPRHQGRRLEDEGDTPAARFARVAPGWRQQQQPGRRSARAGRRPASTSVLLPQPDGPSRVTNSPSPRSVRSTGNSACGAVGVGLLRRQHLHRRHGLSLGHRGSVVDQLHGKTLASLDEFECV